MGTAVLNREVTVGQAARLSARLHPLNEYSFRRLADLTQVPMTNMFGGPSIWAMAFHYTAGGEQIIGTITPQEPMEDPELVHPLTGELITDQRFAPIAITRDEFERRQAERALRQYKDALAQAQWDAMHHTSEERLGYLLGAAQEVHNENMAAIQGGIDRVGSAALGQHWNSMRAYVTFRNPLISLGGDIAFALLDPSPAGEMKLLGGIGFLGLAKRFKLGKRPSLFHWKTFSRMFGYVFRGKAKGILSVNRALRSTLKSLRRHLNLYHRTRNLGQLKFLRKEILNHYRDIYTIREFLRFLWWLIRNLFR